jgi:ParB-like chromosome segregation protein Spo0J
VIIERIPVDQVHPSAYNPRKDLQPTDAEYQAIKRSLDKWDAVEPLVWNRRTGNLVGGHQRFKILLARGDTDVDVSVVDLNDADERALNLALNKITGKWEDTKLFDLLANLESDGFDLTLAGFEPTVLSSLSKELTAPIFQPAAPVAPPRELTYEQVRPVDVAAAERNAATRFQQPPPKLHEITCPHCGRTFGG